MRKPTFKVFEIWVSNKTQYEAICGYGEMRHNATFGEQEDAANEVDWYVAKGYLVEMREALR